MRTAAVLALVTVASALPATAASTSSTFTDVSSCRSVDFQPDEFAHFCRGPSGLAAVLYYADGRAAATFGPAAKGKRDEVRDGAGGDMEPLGIGAAGKPYGDKIEWVSVGGDTPCATVVRMNLEAGSRLVVTKLGKSPERVAIVKGNKEAQAAAAKACGGAVKTAASGGVSNGNAKPTKITYTQLPLTDPTVRRMWKDTVAEALPLGSSDPWVLQATVQAAGGRTLTISQMWSGMHCGAGDCATKVFDGKKEVASFMACSENEFHEISADGRTLVSCGQRHDLF